MSQPARLSRYLPARPASADLLLASAVTLWAFNYTVIKFGLGEIAPLAFPVFRFGIGGLVVLAAVRVREGSVGFERADLRPLFLAGLLGITVGQISFMYALNNTGASDTALLGATGPLVTTIMAAAVRIERPDGRHWLGVAVGLCGATLVIGGGTGGLRLGSDLLGDGLALGNVLASTAGVLAIMPLLSRYSAWRVLAWQMLIGTALLVPLAVPELAAQNYAAISPAAWGSLAYATFASGIVTNLLYYTAMGRVGPSRAAIYQYLQTFLAVVLAIVVLGEQITPAQVLGGLVVVGGVVLGGAAAGRSAGKGDSAAGSS